MSHESLKTILPPFLDVLRVGYSGVAVVAISRADQKSTMICLKRRVNSEYIDPAKRRLRF